MESRVESAGHAVCPATASIMIDVPVRPHAAASRCVALLAQRRRSSPAGRPPPSPDARPSRDAPAQIDLNLINLPTTLSLEAGTRVTSGSPIASRAICAAAVRRSGAGPLQPRQRRDHRPGIPVRHHQQRCRRASTDRCSARRSRPSPDGTRCGRATTLPCGLGDADRTRG